nr:hypothetical protein Iba_chr06aCG9370 [Ipomoea batatas]
MELIGLSKLIQKKEMQVVANQEKRKGANGPGLRCEIWKMSWIYGPSLSLSDASACRNLRWECVGKNEKRVGSWAALSVALIVAGVGMRRQECIKTVKDWDWFGTGESLTLYGPFMNRHVRPPLKLRLFCHVPIEL